MVESSTNAKTKSSTNTKNDNDLEQGQVKKVCWILEYYLFFEKKRQSFQACRVILTIM